MQQNSKELDLYERIKIIAQRAPINREFIDDLIQEAWLGALFYAKSKGKDIENLSNREILYRCLEAAKKVRPANFVLSDDIELMLDKKNPLPREELENKEDKLNAKNYANKIENLLKYHPSLSLSERQEAVFNQLKIISPDEKNVWRSNYAKSQGISRQRVWNIEKTVKNKAHLARDFIHLIEGDIESYFSRHASTWRAPVIRQTLWGVVKPNLGTSSPLRKNLQRLNNSLLESAFNKLSRQITKNNNKFEPAILAQAYHQLIAAVYLDYEGALSWLKSLKSEFSGKDWLIDKFLLRGFHILKSDIHRSEYREWLIYLCKNFEMDEAKKYAAYIVSYFGGISEENVNKFLSSGGIFKVDKADINPIIKDSYSNIREYIYTESKILLDINFLRVALVLFVYGMSGLTQKSKNSLKTICQKAQHSKIRYINEISSKLISR